MNKYANAFSEVSEILSFLNYDEFSKIPKGFIDVIEKNKNRDYIYTYDTSKDLVDQDMLQETKAILMNIFRDYLADSEQKEKIIKMQKADLERIENEKRLKYNVDVFSNKNKTVDDKPVQENNQLVEISKTSFFIIYARKNHKGRPYVLPECSICFAEVVNMFC